MLIQDIKSNLLSNIPYRCNFPHLGTMPTLEAFIPSELKLLVIEPVSTHCNINVTKGGTLYTLASMLSNATNLKFPTCNFISFSFVTDFSRRLKTMDKNYLQVVSLYLVEVTASISINRISERPFSSSQDTILRSKNNRMYTRTEHSRPCCIQIYSSRHN